jgi:hypothetical protein
VTASVTLGDGSKREACCARMRLETLWLVVVLGCGAASRDCPRTIATDAEIRAAREHGKRAAANSQTSVSSLHVWDEPYSGQTWYPWFYYWDPDLERARLAAAGLDATAAIELEHRASCNRIPEQAQARSPLDTYSLGTTRLRDGVLLRVAADAGPPEVLLVRLRCHRAWLRRAVRAGAQEDVVAIAGLKIVVHAGAHDGIDVLFSSDDPVVLGEVERRARIAVTRAGRLRAKQRH